MTIWTSFWHSVVSFIASDKFGVPVQYGIKLSKQYHVLGMPQGVVACNPGRCSVPDLRAVAKVLDRISIVHKDNNARAAEQSTERL